MGDNVSVEERKNFEEKLQFVQKAEDQHFGLIDIFRFKQPPYEYIMDYQKTFIEGDARYEVYANFLSELKQKEHKNLAKLHFSEVRKGIWYIIQKPICALRIQKYTPSATIIILH